MKLLALASMHGICIVFIFTLRLFWDISDVKVDDKLQSQKLQATNDADVPGTCKEITVDCDGVQCVFEFSVFQYIGDKYAATLDDQSSSSVLNNDGGQDNLPMPLEPSPLPNLYRRFSSSLPEIDRLQDNRNAPKSPLSPSLQFQINDLLLADLPDPASSISPVQRQENYADTEPSFRQNSLTPLLS